MKIEEARIQLPNGAEIVAQRYDYDGEHPEMAVCLWKDGVVIQDLCMIRPNEDDKNDVEILVWGDEVDEDYTHKFIIPQYEEVDDE